MHFITRSLDALDTRRDEAKLFVSFSQNEYWRIIL
jgi:hypothetical protein